jgi:hypothetical protein
VWRSVNGGRTWSVSVVTGIPELFRVVALTRAGNRWVAVGTTNVKFTPGTVVLTNTDGVRWAPGIPVGRGEISAATVDSSGDGVGPWRRGELGCGDSPPQAAVTLTDGRVLIASNRDLWIRTSGTP